jgi:hypothetical protein
MKDANTLAYNDTATFAAVSYIIQTLAYYSLVICDNCTYFLTGACTIKLLKATIICIVIR